MRTEQVSIPTSVDSLPDCSILLSVAQRVNGSLYEFMRIAVAEMNGDAADAGGDGALAGWVAHLPGVPP